MKFFFKLVIAALLMISFPYRSYSGSTDSGQSEHNAESWYLLLGVGYPVNAYPDNVRTNIDNFTKLNDESHFTLSLDVGVYWPLENNLLLGITLNGYGDSYDTKDEYIMISNYMVGGSAVWYFGGYIGKGFFLRGDLGIAQVDVSDKNSIYNENNIGFSVKADAGYSVPLSRETRVEFDLGFRYGSVNSESYTALSFGFNVLL